MTRVVGAKILMWGKYLSLKSGGVQSQEDGNCAIVSWLHFYDRFVAWGESVGCVHIRIQNYRENIHNRGTSNFNVFLSQSNIGQLKMKLTMSFKRIKVEMNPITRREGQISTLSCKGVCIVHLAVIYHCHSGFV